jgi:hypothetical protein
VFGSASDVITVELRGVRLGLSVRNSASSFAWFGPVFLPLIPIPGRETLQTSQLSIWLAIVPQSDVDVLLNQLRIRLPGHPAGIPPSGIYIPSLARIDTASVNEPHHVAGGDGASWYLDFTLPGAERATSFELQVSGFTTAEGPLAPTLVSFSNVRGWRVLSLP